MLPNEPEKALPNEPEKASIPFKDRDYLRLYREPPREWRIWIGRYLRGRWKGYWIHHSVPITENIPEELDAPVPLPNTQTTTFIVGQLFVHAMSSALPDITEKFSGRPPSPNCGRFEKA